MRKSDVSLMVGMVLELEAMGVSRKELQDAAYQFDLRYRAAEVATETEIRAVLLGLVVEARLKKP